MIIYHLFFLPPDVTENHKNDTYPCYFCNFIDIKKISDQCIRGGTPDVVGGIEEVKGLNCHYIIGTLQG